MSINSLNDIMQLNQINFISFKDMFENSVLSGLGFGGGFGGFGMCCCTGYIKSKINSLIKYFSQNIKKEIAYTNSAIKLMKKINSTDNLKGDKWNKGLYGKINASMLTEDYLLSKPLFLIKKIEKKEELLIKADLATSKELNLNQKLGYYKTIK